MAAGYRFGPFLLDIENASLVNAGVSIELRPKAFDALHYLVAHAGRLLSKDDLVGAIWPNVTVNDDALAQCIRDVRRALDDHAQHYIRTVPRRGYVFIPETTLLDGAQSEDARSAGTNARLTIAVLPFGTRGGRQPWLGEGLAGT